MAKMVSAAVNLVREQHGQRLAACQVEALAQWAFQCRLEIINWLLLQWVHLASNLSGSTRPSGSMGLTRFNANSMIVPRPLSSRSRSMPPCTTHMQPVPRPTARSSGSLLPWTPLSAAGVGAARSAATIDPDILQPGARLGQPTLCHATVSTRHGERPCLGL